MHNSIGTQSCLESCDNSTQTSEVASEDDYNLEETPQLISSSQLQATTMLSDNVSAEFVSNTSSEHEKTNLNATILTEKISLNSVQDRFILDEAALEIPANVSEEPVTPANNPDEPLTPEPLPESLLKEYSDQLTVMDKYHLECLLSKHWQLREKSLQSLEKELESNSRFSDTITAFRAIRKVLLRGLNDRVSNVFFSAIQVLRAYVTRFAVEVPARELHNCLCDITSILLEKLGDSNARTREAAADMLMYFAVLKEVGLNVVTPLMLKVPKTLSMWKPILGRLQWLLTAISKFGLQPQGRGGSPGFATEALMHFVVHCFNYPSGEVRSAAMKVTTEVYKIMGLGVEKYLKGVKPMIREVIIGLFEKTGEDELSASSSNSRAKSTLEAAKPTKNSSSSSSSSFKLPDSIVTSPQKGKTVVESFERQSYPQPVTARNKYAERFDMAQSSSRSCWIEASSSSSVNAAHLHRGKLRN